MIRLLALFPLFALLLYGQAWKAQEAALTGSANSFNNGTGHSWADVDGDGDFDLFLNGNQSLWLNKLNEDGKFANANAMLPPLSGNGWAACFGDYDNDGDPDVHCGNSGIDFLLQNNWPDPFVDVAPALQLTDGDWNQSVNWVDYNNDGRLDIYITHERPSTDGPHEFYENDFPNPFIPRFPTGGGADEFGLADLNSHAYGLSWADFDLDGDLDAVTSACGSSSTIPNENPHNKIYRNRHPDPGFDDLSLATGLVNAGEVIAGSDAYWATLFDYDGDAFPDLFIGDNDGDHRLWRNTGQNVGDFGIQLIDGMVHNTGGDGAFLESACAGDYDNDGDLDLYTTTDGLFENNGDGSFSNRSDLVSGSGTDASFVDYDRDGHLDVFNFADLWQNPGGYGNHWLAIELEGDPGTGVTRSAHHVKIRVLANGVNQYREHRFMVGSYSQHMLPTHFGLGAAETVEELQITWNNANVTTFEDLTVDRYVKIVQGADCSGNLGVAQTSFHFCPGDPVSLSATSSNGLPVAWSVLEGPSDAPTQFSDPSSLNTDFTADLPGHYRLGLSYAGCPQVLQVDLYDGDYNGDGTIDADDFLISVGNWRETAGIEVYDTDANGVVDVMDLLFDCPDMAAKAHGLTASP